MFDFNEFPGRDIEFTVKDFGYEWDYIVNTCTLPIMKVLEKPKFSLQALLDAYFRKYHSRDIDITMWFSEGEFGGVTAYIGFYDRYGDQINKVRLESHLGFWYNLSILCGN